MIKVTKKPKRRIFSLEKTFAQDIEYFCTTKILDEMVMKKLKKPFNKELADAMEKEVRFYIIIKKDLKYNIFPGTQVESWIKDNKIEEKPLSKNAKACINHYIQAIGY